MRNHIDPGERATLALHVAPPGAWWSVDEDDVTIERGGGVGLAYRLRPGGDPRPIRDGRGRSALEAFTALPFEVMRRRLDGYLESLKDAEPQQAPLRDALRELVEFVTTFGPVGVAWGVTFPASNGRADRLAWKVAEHRVADHERAGVVYLSAAERERHLESLYLAERGRGSWIVSFWGMAADRWGFGEVRIEANPWRAADLFTTLADEQQDLRRTVVLADALARQDEGATGEALRAMHADPKAAERWALQLNEPGGERWARALRGERPADGLWRPFDPEPEADWLTLGRLVLADLIGRHLNFTLPRIEVGETDRFTLGFKAGSLLEHIYLELLHHVRRRPQDAEPGEPDPYFETPRCEVCEGAILATRLRVGYVNRWHSGCRPAGKARQHRVRVREATEAGRL